MSIAVIVVNYNTADLVITGVESVLARNHAGRSVEIHVVDNASPTGDAGTLTQAHEAKGWGDAVTLWLEEENHGFGRGNNIVINALLARETPPEFVFLLNPDAHLENETLDILASHLEAHADVGAVGAGIALPDGTDVRAAFRFPNWQNDLMRAINFGPLFRLLESKREPLPPETPAGPVDWVSGAAVMFRSSALRAVDGFDPVFFLYFEEVDLMHRMAEAGFSSHYQPQARVIHHEGAATNVQSGAAERRRRPPYLYRSWRRYHSQWGQAALRACINHVTSGLGAALAKLRGKPSHLPLNFFSDHWRYVVAPLLGLGRDPDFEADLARARKSLPVTATHDQISRTGPSQGTRVCGTVAIGRNEGERLVRGLASLQGQTAAIVYVDSNSTDASVAEARAARAHVVELDMSVPFTAARARNAGYAKLIEVAGDIDYVQFLDGDCELDPDWIETAVRKLDGEPDLAGVCGRNREKFPEASLWNKMIDAEWETPIGEAKACGGNMMVRRTAFEAVDGFREDLIAGEEPEMCFRMRQKGWRFFRIDAEMTLHDAAMTRFSHWWKRARRSGHTWAEGVALHGKSSERYRVAELRRTLIWGLLIPAVALLGALFVSPWSLLLLLAWPLQILRLTRRGMPFVNAFFMTLSKLAETQGVLVFWGKRLLGHRQGLIEYK